MQGTGEDLQAWQNYSLIAYDQGPLRSQLNAESRFIGDGFLGYWLVQPIISYRVHPKLGLALGGSYFQSRSDEDVPWHETYRVEFAASPRFPLTDTVTFDWRNRVDLRWQENRDYDLVVFYRSRARLTWRPESAGPLRSLAIAVEPFYDVDAETWNENRFFPLIANFKVVDGANLGAYGMLRSRRQGQSSEWETDYIIGATLSLNLSALFGD